MIIILQLKRPQVKENLNKNRKRAKVQFNNPNLKWKNKKKSNMKLTGDAGNAIGSLRWTIIAIAAESTSVIMKVSLMKFLKKSK